MKRAAWGIGSAVILALVAGGGWFIAWRTTHEETQQKAEALSQGALTLYLYDGQADLEGDVPRCFEDSLVPVTRQVGAAQANIPYAIAIIISGDLTESERADGYVPLFPSTIWELSGSAFRDGVLTLSFARRSAGEDRCSGLAGVQLQKTLAQFPSVKDVRFEPEGVFDAP
jgi:hypothetical protein